jgi:prolipoprotein diacylglyceryl transferase
MVLVGSIPSPSDGAIHLGPLQLRAYGLMIALGVVAAVWLASRRWVQRGGSPDDISAVAVWAVPAGVVGARLYHVITDWRRFTDEPWRAVYIWEGGLGIWGGIALGVAVGLWAARRRGMALLPLLDAAAPALALAQAIGRWGNWFNQELFGRPTDVPWALEIDPSHRPDRYLDEPTFHPTFLYESLWNLALVGVLLLIDRRRKLRPGRLFVCYVAGYTFARFFIERIRVDPASMILGLRVNEWVSAILFLGAVGILVADRFRHAPAPGEDEQVRSDA